MKNKWYRLPAFLLHYNLTDLLKILDDATVNGFEFKVENHHILYRYIA